MAKRKHKQKQIRKPKKEDSMKGKTEEKLRKAKKTDKLRKAKKMTEKNKGGAKEKQRRIGKQRIKTEEKHLKGDKQYRRHRNRLKKTKTKGRNVAQNSCCHRKKS